MTRTMSRVYDQHLAAVGLKTTQYSLLANVARAALPVAELADILATERTTLTRNLKPLIEAGWVTLNPGADGRVRMVTITPAGLAKVKSAKVAWRAAQDETERLLGRDAVRALHHQLDATLTRLLPLLDGQHHAKPA
ncbi:MarR family transcriptional regulator [Massilia glaciei]|uniref:MarR family transcriptional regulator n=1 Tax=Massilia glaciei TaxID=1524097 RepID=A0A2U2HLP3_9BURK|nr:MarR family transcriptional regulator [Massilia glaciei]